MKQTCEFLSRIIAEQRTSNPAVPAPGWQSEILVRMNGSRWSSHGNPVSVTKLMTALRKSLVRSV